MPGTQSIRTGLCVGQTSREPANLSATAGTRKALRKTIAGRPREEGDVPRGCRGLKLKRDSRTDSLVSSEDSNFARGPFPARFEPQPRIRVRPWMIAVYRAIAGNWGAALDEDSHCSFAVALSSGQPYRTIDKVERSDGGPSRSVSTGLTEWQDPRVRATIGRRTPWKADALAAKSGID
jgi:hypothetical protein